MDILSFSVILVSVLSSPVASQFQKLHLLEGNAGYLINNSKNDFKNMSQKQLEQE